MTDTSIAIKIGLGIKTFIEGFKDIQTHRKHGDLIRLIASFQNKGSRLKTGKSNSIEPH
jgi:hypothetical protein